MRRGFTIIEVLIAIVIVAIGIIGVIALLTQSLKVAGQVVEDSFAATIARSVYEAIREGARKRAFMVEESGHVARGLVIVHDGVYDAPSGFMPPPVPATMTDTTRLNALRASDFAIFLPQSSPYPNGEVYFLFPRPTAAAAENAWIDPAGGQDDSFFPANAIASRQTAPPDHSGHPNRFDVQRIYWIKNRPLPAAAPGVQPDASDQYGFAIAVRRAAAPSLSNGTAPIQWMNPNGTPNPANFPPRNVAPQDGLYQVEVMVFRNFEASPQSRHHLPVPGGSFAGLLAVGP